MILFDALVEGSDSPESPAPAPQLYHSLHIARNRQSFATVAGTFRLARFVHFFPDAITFLHNGLSWAPTDTDEHTFQNGDHLQVIFGPYRGASHREDLIAWLADEGIPAWPDLMMNSSEPSLPATVPFSVQQPSSSAHPPTVCQDDSGPAFRGGAFNTWFISHSRHPECDASRTLVMSTNFDAWRRSIERLWQDRFDPSRPFAVSWLLPKPPATGVPTYDALPHLLIEQDMHPHMAGALLAVCKLLLSVSEVVLKAYSVSSLMTATAFLETAQVQQQCAGRDPITKFPSLVPYKISQYTRGFGNE